MILKLKSKGERVKELQRLLGLKDDGDFGPKTKEAVIKFQNDKKLTVDGVVGPKTWALLIKKNDIIIKPINGFEDKKEDLSDPEDEMKVPIIKETLPTCSNVVELINLINNSTITRKVNKLIFHCTATNQNATISAIMKYWKDNLGWKNPGYHIIVRADGSWTQLQDFNMVTNGVAGMNSTSLNISYIGGIDSKGRGLDNRTDEQKEILETIYLTLKHKLPKLTFHGHYEFSKKECPSFNVKEWMEDVDNKLLVS
jgi:N-acetylmuramoyl-L-alanine amidase